MDRRTFLKIAGMGSMVFASACTRESEKRLYSLVKSPEDMVTGKAHWYASTCRECPAGCGVLAKNREGRVIKLEGNPIHPINQGKLCIRGQAALQGIYNPDRLKSPQLNENGKWRAITYQEATRILRAKIEAAVASGPNGVHMLTAIEGHTLTRIFAECMDQWQSAPPLVFETLAYDHLKKANEIVFGINGLIGYRIDRADFLIGFGADFLETWLSPVEYARQFKAMHSYQNGRKGLFYQISPCRTLTGANADAWIQCPPGAETIVCMGLIRQILNRRAHPEVPNPVKRALEQIAQPFTREKVLRLTGIDQALYDRMVTGLLEAQNPLILPTGVLNQTRTDLQTHIGVNLLNYLLDPQLSNFDFDRRHRVQRAATRSEIRAFFEQAASDEYDVLLLNNTNPVYTLPPSMGVTDILNRPRLFVVSFSDFMDETAEQADLVFPTSLPLETWGEYGGYEHLLSTQQPAMTALNGAPSIGDVFLQVAGNFGANVRTGKHELISQLKAKWRISDERAWLKTISGGGQFEPYPGPANADPVEITTGFEPYFDMDLSLALESPPALVALPSIRFYDGRGANKPWLCEIPDPVTKVAWQNPLMVNPETANKNGIAHGDLVTINNTHDSTQAQVFETDDILPGLLAIQVGQGHDSYGRYAAGQGANPFKLFSIKQDVNNAPLFTPAAVSIVKNGVRKKIAHTDGSMDQHGRKIALAATIEDLHGKSAHKKAGLTMHDFPMTLPLPEGYDPKRDFYPPHDHKDYRWAMVVDLDRCVGCGACSAACYAENNLGVVGEQQIINGREMSWIRIERYRRIDAPDDLIFLPMLCQHCDNAPCESVCPVFAPHHNKEGLNNQIYNRCIGTRFCAQNCPYKVRRFNWFEWQWPGALSLQLNPDVTVRTKGVMEKCSFCVQRIKEAHGAAKDENRMIKDGEVTPACVQTCPTDALVFGSLMDPSSRVSRLVKDRRAYQVMGYLNTKPAVIYLKKVVNAV